MNAIGHVSRQLLIYKVLFFCVKSNSMHNYTQICLFEIWSFFS